MASSRSRQRKLARVRYERQLARRAQKERRRRQILAGVGVAVMVGLIVVGSMALLGGSGEEPPPQSEPGRCVWLPHEASTERIDAGTPPENPPIFGERVVTMEVDAGSNGSGEVELTLTVDVDPCSVASLEHLAAQGFYDETTCHAVAFQALFCGDPSGTGRGGPTYSFWAGENIPPAADDGDDEDGEDGEEREPAYPAGTVAFGDLTGGGGSQFLIFYEDFDTDSPLWSVIGRVTGGMELIEAIGKAGTVEGSLAPAETVTITSLRVVDPEAQGAEDDSQDSGNGS